MERVCKLICFIAVVSMLIVCVSCEDDSYIARRLDYIKAEGDTNPQFAMDRFDSLRININDCSEAVAMKYWLLNIRLRDKSYITAKSDNMVSEIVDYYEKHGNDRERQEAYYYAGSVYRDLKDTPRSLEYFLKAEETAENGDGCDSLMLRNTYSNLYLLYKGSMLDKEEAYKYAQKECRLSRRIGKVELGCMPHLGSILLAMDSTERAHKVLVEVLDSIYITPLIYDNAERLTQLQRNFDMFSDLLCMFSYLNDTINVERSARLLDKTKIGYEDNSVCFAYGYYYNMMGETDSCIKAFKRIIDNNNDIMKMSSAAQILTTIYDYLGLQNESHKYSKMFMRLNDSLDLGERQKTAFTTHNQFQYQKNKNQVDDLMEKFDKMKTGTRASMILSIIVLVLAVCIIIHIKKRNKEKLNEREKEQARLKTVIEEKKKKGVLLNAHVKEVETELSTFKTQAQHLNSELRQVKELLHKKNKELSERKKQSQSLMDTLYSSKLDNGAQDAKHLIITKLNEGKPLDSADWTLIYSAVDRAFPNFRTRLLSSENAHLDGKHMNAYYLACMGLSIRQIEKLTGTSRSSVSRILAGADWIKSDSPFMSAEPEE